MTVQDHIHLSDTLGGAPENSPNKTYKAVNRVPFYNAEVDVVRGWTGKLFTNVLEESGSPLIFDEYDYDLRVTTAELAELRGFLYSMVYFVDHDHVADAQDHTTYVRQMFFAAMKYKSRFDPMLSLHTVAISLIDGDTV